MKIKNLFSTPKKTAITVVCIILILAVCAAAAVLIAGAIARRSSIGEDFAKQFAYALFKQAVNLSKQARAIEATLDGITPFNAGKKKEEALSMLKKWFPQMENFSGQLKKYKVTISDLLAENEKLEARARASENGKMKDRMERAKLESELQNIQKLVDRIPPEVLAELKRQQRHTKER